MPDFIQDMRLENASNNGPLGKPNKITLHWTAGNYTTTYDHYHFCVLGNGDVVETRSINLIGSHTWHRNTGNIGISMSCMASSKFPPTREQIESTALLVAELMGIYGIQEGYVKDHSFYARLDGYANLRWDIGPYFAVIMPKVRWYREKLIKGEIQNRLKGKIK